MRDDLVRREVPVELSEAIFVADEPVDDSAAILESLRARHPWMRIVTLSRNFGQHPATVAGILHSAGDWVATLDEDMQHEPRQLLPLLAQAVRQHSDVVYARAQVPVHESRMRDLTSRFLKKVVGRMTGNPHVPKFNSFRLLRGSVARAAAAVSAYDTYFDISVGWFTNRIGTLDLPMKDRRYIESGRSGYDFPALVRHAWRMMASSEMKFLRAGATVGILSLAGSVLVGVAVVVGHLYFPAVIAARGWASLLLAVLFFGGLVSFLTGISIEILTSLAIQAKGKPPFFVIDRSKDALLSEEALTASPE